MPYRYKKGIKRRRRRKQSRVPRNGLIGMGNRIGSDPFPQSYLARLTYVARVKVTPTIADVLEFHLFSCNGLFAPETTGGHQPMGFDELMILYNKFEVLGSKITADCQVIPTSIATANVVVGIHVNDDASIQGNSLDQLLENGRTNYKTLTDNQQKARLTYKWSQKKILGPNVRGTGPVKGTSLGNPTLTSNYALYTQAVDPLIIGDPVDCLVRLDYFVRFTERGDTPQS